MNAIYRNKDVYPQINKHFGCIDIDSSKAIARLPSLCGYTPSAHAISYNRQLHFTINMMLYTRTDIIITGADTGFRKGGRRPDNV